MPLLLSIAIAAGGCSGDLGEPGGGATDAGFAVDSGAGSHDGGSQDAGAPDAGSGDAGGSDAGAEDAGAGDAGSDGGADAGTASDAGDGDAGTSDAGAADAGGPTDAGSGCLVKGSYCIPASANCCTGTTCEQLLSSSTTYVCHETMDDGDGGKCVVEGQACAVTPCCTTCWQNFCCQSDGAPCNTGFECCSGWCEPTSHTCLTL